MEWKPQLVMRFERIDNVQLYDHKGNKLALCQASRLRVSDGDGNVLFEQAEPNYVWQDLFSHANDVISGRSTKRYEEIVVLSRTCETRPPVNRESHDPAFAAEVRGNILGKQHDA